MHSLSHHLHIIINHAHTCPYSLGNSGLKVSKIILGAMSYGSSDWQEWVLNESDALPLLKHAYDLGINTWDTANVYSNGRSESIIGTAIKKYSIPRSSLVILSKCYFGVSLVEGEQPGIAEVSKNDGHWVNRQGLSRKNILDQVEESCKRLGTYIDVLQIHRLDRETPKEEIMRALNDVVESGMVRYIGASSVSCLSYHHPFHPAISKIGRERNVLTAYPTKKTDGSLGIPTTPKHRRKKRVAQIHLHAKLPQPPLPRGRTRNDTLLQRHRRRNNPLVTDRTRRSRPSLQFPLHVT